MTDGLLIPRDSPVHRLPAHPKIVALVAFVLVVVATPPGAWLVFAAQAAILAAAVGVARVPADVVARRTLVEAPFVVFALLLPFVATGPRVTVGPVALSEAGLVGAGTLLARTTLGVVAAILLAASTDPRALLVGLDRLRLPATLVAVMAFMLRYLHLVVDGIQRQRIARAARGGRAGLLAATAGGTATLFVRSYERGERVQQAMLARGYTGRMPVMEDAPARPSQWLAAAVLPLAAGLALAVGLVTAP